MSFLYNWIKGFEQAPQENKPEEKTPVPHYMEHKYPVLDTVPKKIYDALDWTKNVIGGSYALKQFIGASWKPNDVDIFGMYENKDEFNDECKKFQDKAELELIKEVWNEQSLQKQQELQKKHENELPEQDFTEDFDSSILGTKTYKSKECEEKIQMVGISKEYIEKVRPERKTITDVLEQITDIPACVQYKIENGKKVFIVPEKGLGVLFTGMTENKNICSKRKRKYEGRGFQFFDPNQSDLCDHNSL